MNLIKYNQKFRKRKAQDEGVREQNAQNTFGSNREKATGDTEFV
jgi:hypothetical protein